MIDFAPIVEACDRKLSDPKLDAETRRRIETERAYALRDWARYNERHGVPLR